MLELEIKGTEHYNSETNEFSRPVLGTLRLEHSLVSLSKWEAKWEKPFLGKDEKTPEEILDYIECMIIDEDYDRTLLEHLDGDNLAPVSTYLSAKRTATWFTEMPGAKKSTETITAELIYYWMTVHRIPFTCETWHLNTLLTLIRVCNAKQEKPKKKSRAALAAERRAINEQRKAKLGTSG